MTVRDKVEGAMRRHPGLTAREISSAVFGLRHGYQQRVNAFCLDLCREGRAHRTGTGTRKAPYRYFWGNQKA